MLWVFAKKKTTKQIRPNSHLPTLYKKRNPNTASPLFPLSAAAAPPPLLPLSVIFTSRRPPPTSKRLPFSYLRPPPLSSPCSNWHEATVGVANSVGRSAMATRGGRRVPPPPRQRQPTRPLLADGPPLRRPRVPWGGRICQPPLRVRS